MEKRIKENAIKNQFYVSKSTVDPTLYDGKKNFYVTTYNFEGKDVNEDTQLQNHLNEMWDWLYIDKGKKLDNLISRKKLGENKEDVKEKILTFCLYILLLHSRIIDIYNAQSKKNPEDKGAFEFFKNHELRYRVTGVFFEKEEYHSQMAREIQKEVIYHEICLDTTCAFANYYLNSAGNFKELIDDIFHQASKKIRMIKEKLENEKKYGFDLYALEELEESIDEICKLPSKKYYILAMEYFTRLFDIKVESWTKGIIMEVEQKYWQEFKLTSPPRKVRKNDPIYSYYKEQLERWKEETRNIIELDRPRSWETPIIKQSIEDYYMKRDFLASIGLMDSIYQENLKKKRNSL